MGGDIDGRGGRVEAGRLQRIRGGRGGGLIDVAQQDRLAYADPAGNCLTDGARADDDDHFYPR